MYLAIKPGEIHTILELSERFKISRNHLMKVVNRLVHFGYVDSLRGRNGGLRLAKPKNTISIGAVIEDMEQTLDIVDCSADGGCVYERGCKLKYALKDATRSFIRTLHGYTLEDLVANEKQLLKLVG